MPLETNKCVYENVPRVLKVIYENKTIQLLQKTLYY